MATNSPDSLRNVNSDDLSSISSDSRSRSPTGKSLLERELESLREKAVARNVRDKYSGSGSFMSPEDAMAYISKQRKKTSNPTTPPSNLTSSAEISDWYMVQRQRELEERKKREEAEAFLRAYRGGSAAYFIESPTQPPPVVASPTPITPVFSKDRKTSGSVSTPITPPMTNVTSPSKMESPKPVPSPENSKKNPNTVVVTTTAAAAKPVDATLSAQSSIAQLDAYLRSVRGAAALQSKKNLSTTKGDPNSTTSTPSSTTQEKQTGPSPTAIKASIVETKAPSPPTPKTTVDGKVHETKSIAVTTKSSPPPTPKVAADVKGNETKSIVETAKASPPSTKMIDSKNQDTKARPSPTTKVTNLKIHESKQVDPLEETLPNQSTSQAKSNSPNTKGEIQTSSAIPITLNPVNHSESTLISKLEAIHIAKDLPLDRKTIGPNDSSSSWNHPFDEDGQAHPPSLIARKTSEHRQTQVDNSMLQQRGSKSLAVGQLDSFLRSVRVSVPSDDGKPPHNSVISSTQNVQPPMISSIDLAPSSKLVALPSQSSLTTSSISGDLLIPTMEKKSSRVELKVDTQWNGRTFSHDSGDHYIDLLDEDAPESVQKHHGLNLSLVTPNVARNPKPPFSDLSKEISPNATTSPYRLESHASANMMKYSPVYKDGPTSSFEQGGDKRRYSEDIMGSRDSMKSPLQLLDSASFQNDPADHLLVQDVDDEEDRFGSFQSGGKIVGRNIWTLPSDERSLDGGGSVMTSTSTSSKSISQNTEYRSSSSFQRLVQQQKEKYERRLKTRAEEHVEQIDEIIQQLNSIEVKYQADISNLRASFTMKESNMVSLNALIVQARVKNAKLTDEAAQQQAIYSAQRVEYDAVFKIQKDLEASIQGVQNEIKKTLAEREKLIAEAIRSAQEEIKIAAEKQFAQSNIAFIQLKKDLAVVEDEKKVWFKRAEEATSKLDDISSNSNRRIDDLARQVSKAREELEFSKTDVSRTKQQLVNERTVFTERVESMTRDVSRLGKECAEAHQLAETIEQEKSQLKQEADELKALSDELMSIVGG